MNVLTLIIAEYLNEGIVLPKTAFHHAPYHTFACMNVDEKAIERTKCLTYSQASDELGVSHALVNQSVKAEQLESRMFNSQAYVTFASLNERRANPPAPHLPRKAASNHSA